jgi:hypothetical protein
MPKKELQASCEERLLMEDDPNLLGGEFRLLLVPFRFLFS